MKYALNLKEDGRILSVTFEKYAVGNMPLVDHMPDGDVSDYIYQNGAYIYSPLPKPVEVVTKFYDDAVNALLGVTE